MGLREALWLGLPFLIVVLISLLCPRRRAGLVEVWSDSRAVWKRLGGKTIELIFWEDVCSVSVSQRENAFGRPERTYLLRTSDDVEHEFSASTVKEEFIQTLRGLPGFTWERFCEAVDSSYPRTVLCWSKGAPP